MKSSKAKQLRALTVLGVGRNRRPSDRANRTKTSRSRVSFDQGRPRGHFHHRLQSELRAGARGSKYFGGLKEDRSSSSATWPSKFEPATVNIKSLSSDQWLACARTELSLRPPEPAKAARKIRGQAHQGLSVERKNRQRTTAYDADVLSVSSGVGPEDQRRNHL